jgi:hypothetical protein
VTPLRTSTQTSLLDGLPYIYPVEPRKEPNFSSVIQYENDVKAGRFLVVAQGTQDEVKRAKEVLASAKPTSVASHPA